MGNITLKYNETEQTVENVETFWGIHHSTAWFSCVVGDNRLDVRWWDGMHWWPLGYIGGRSPRCRHDRTHARRSALLNMERCATYYCHGCKKGTKFTRQINSQFCHVLRFFEKQMWKDILLVACALVFKARMNALTCVPCFLHMTASPDSPVSVTPANLFVTSLVD